MFENNEPLLIKVILPVDLMTDIIKSRREESKQIKDGMRGSE